MILKGYMDRLIFSYRTYVGDEDVLIKTVVESSRNEVPLHRNIGEKE
jgi:hypothetical protein